MQFDVQAFLDRARAPYRAKFFADLQSWDFGGFALSAPADCTFSAERTEDGALLALHAAFEVDAQCARCLDPVHEAYTVDEQYLVRRADLSDPDFELPRTEKGALALEELVYQEILFRVPGVLLCSPDCQGICPICGRKKSVGHVCRTADAAAPADARLSILKQLLP